MKFSSCKTIAAVFLTIGFLINGCAAQSDVGYSAASISIKSNPLTIDVISDGKTLVCLGGLGKAAFYVASDEKNIEIEEITEITTREQKTSITAKLNDGRLMRIAAAVGPQGSASFSAEVDDKRTDENICVRFIVGETEGFYGLMERVVDGNQDNSWKEGMSEGFNLRGQRVELIVKFTLSVYSPLFVSSAGWGASIQSAWPGVYEFGIEDPRLLTVKQEGPSLSILIIPGPTPKDVTERYARATALSLLPPRWAFGHFRWRDDIYNHPAFFDGTPYNGPYNSMVVEDILMLEALGIPTTLYWIDRPFGKGDFGYDNIGWDESRVPKAKEMISWLKSKGINFMLWVCPWASGDKMLSEAAENDYIVDGQALMPPLSAKLIDFTIPAAADWWQGYLKERIADGVAGFKLDRADEKVPDGLFYEGMYRDGTDFREGRNLYPVWYAKAAHDAFVEAGVKEFIVMPRAAWQGSQKYSTPWGGDSGLSEWGLRSAIIGAQRSAALNFPIWGSDTCGYGGAIDREVCARWLAFSAFTPIMEVGPTGNYAFWSMPKEGEKPVIDEKGYHYETTYDSELLAIYRLYADIHHRLIDYSYSQAKAAHETGQMFIRPMIFMHPDKPEYLDFYEQYYYGPDVIVHPVWRKSQTSATVILPEGEWIDAWTGLSVSSGAISVQTPLYRMPIYIRKGGTADLGDLAALWATAQSVTAIKPDLAVLAETLK